MTSGNERDHIVFAQPTNLIERRAVAQEMAVALEPNFPVLIDTLDDRVNKLYGAWPERLYVIDEEGVIAYQGGYGPWGFKPEKARRALNRTLRFADS